MIQDPPLTTGVPVYQELLESAVGIAGAGQNFDGNGRYLRSSPGGRLDAVQTGLLGSQGPAVRQRGDRRRSAHARRGPVRRRRSRAARPCYQNAAPDLNRVTTGAGP